MSFEGSGRRRRHGFVRHLDVGSGGEEIGECHGILGRGLKTADGTLRGSRYC